jgi:carnitine-CoA ligase
MTITTAVQLPTVHSFVGQDVTTALAERVGRRGEHPFFVWEPGPEGVAASWSYADFATDVDRTAAGLVERGVRAGDAVMLLLDNSPAFAICWFACARLGVVAVDTNVGYKPDELAHALEVTRPVGVITDANLAARCRPLLDSEWLVTVDQRTGTCPALFGDPARLPAHSADPSAPMCIQFTSGTTARPKAAVYTHANILWGARISSAHTQITESDTFFVFMPMFHTAALLWHFMATFWAGGTVVVAPKYSASRFWEISLAHRCTQTMPLGITFATLSSQPVPDHQYRIWQFAVEFPPLEEQYRVRMVGAWGMTEVLTNVLVGTVAQPADPGAIGRLSPEYLVRITDDQGQDVPTGVDGELRVHGVRGLSLFAEYLGDPGATADAFDEAGFFRTGDCVRLLPSGCIQYVTRLKDMLKVGGENVASAEIERVCMQVPGITAAAVVGRRDAFLDEVPVAFVVAPGGAADDVIAEVLDACTAQLASFKVPRSVHILDELPESLIGKIAKAELRTLAEQLAQS